MWAIWRCSCCAPLSYSRAAWVGAMAGIILVATFASRLWILLSSPAACGSPYGEHFISGCRSVLLQDRATLMRLASTRRFIPSPIPVARRGIHRAAHVDLYIGVSSCTYGAEQMGLIGLSASSRAGTSSSGGSGRSGPPRESSRRGRCTRGWWRRLRGGDGRVFDHYFATSPSRRA